jgi:nucleoside-diphosphate-sugar epimerase
VNSTICILGAAGFVGARTLRRFGGNETCVLAHRQAVGSGHTVQGSADDAAALDRLLAPDCVVLNFVYGGAANASRIAEAVGAACARRKVRRLVHISSIDVYGMTPGALIDEGSPCRPVTDYQRAKDACEEILVAASRSAFELVILRPAAVFGPGGRNLESLARRVLREPWPRRYPRACAMGRRRMHAVDVEHVAAAAQWATTAPLSGPAERFIVAQDDEPQNDYASLEAFFARRFGRGAYPVPPIAVPTGVQRLALRLAGRSDAEPQRRYSSAKLAAQGFRAPRPFAEGLAEYADWIRQHANT